MSNDNTYRRLYERQVRADIEHLLRESDIGLGLSNLLEMKKVWLWMLDPPWKSPAADGHYAHWFTWLISWAWALAGLVLGAIVAPLLLRFVGLSSSPYQDWLVIAVAVLAGIVVQTLSWLMIWALAAIVAPVSIGMLRLVYHIVSPRLRLEHQIPFVQLGLYVSIFLVVLVPVGGTLVGVFGAIVYALYRYLTWVGAGQREVTIAFAGALLIKMFAIPLLKGIVTGALIRWLMKWLRGDKDNKGKKTA